MNRLRIVGAGGSVGTRQSAIEARTRGSRSASPANSAARMCMSRSIFANATWRIAAHADLKFLAAVILRKRASGIGAPVSKCRAKRSSPSRSQHQFSMICEGSSTKSHATLVPFSDLISTSPMRWWIRCPNSWKIVSTSRWESSAGRPGAGGVRFPQMTPRWGLRDPSGCGPPVIRAFIQAPPRFDSLGCQSA